MRLDRETWDAITWKATIWSRVCFMIVLNDDGLGTDPNIGSKPQILPGRSDETLQRVQPGLLEWNPKDEVLE